MTTSPTWPEEPRADRGRNYWPALWLVLIMVVVETVRIRLLSMPLERDEGEYAYAGQLMLQGVPPYELSYNMKMPGIYAAYALVMAVFGQSTEGIHLGFMLVNFGAILLLYFVGRRLLEPAGAVAASAAYALLSLSPVVFGFNAHSTHFVVLAALAAMLLLLRAQESGRLAGFFWSGTLFGVAFLMKQPGGAFAFFGGAVMVWAAWRRQPRQWKADALRLALYAAGVAAPIVLTGLALWRAGTWDKFWWWTVTYARVHATAMSWAEGRIRLGSFFRYLDWEWLFWGLAAAGLVGVLTGRGRADGKFFFLSLLLFSAAAVCPTLNFTPHYFVLMLPAVALLAAKAVTVAAAGLAGRPRALVRGAPWILFGLVWAAVAASHLAPFFLWAPDFLSDQLYSPNAFHVYPKVGDYLQRHLPPGATMAVFGSEPELLFYAHRRSVTGYIYMYDLVEDQPFRERMEKEMISEVEQGNPDYVVYINVLTSWIPSRPEYLETIQKWLTKYTTRQYDPYLMVTTEPYQYSLGPDCLKQEPPDKRFIVIFQRKSELRRPTSAP
jgi:hypothetical protein